MAIDPKQEFAIVELERIKWFLGSLDLTVNENAGEHIGEAYENIVKVLEYLRED